MAMANFKHTEVELTNQSQSVMDDSSTGGDRCPGCGEHIWGWGGYHVCPPKAPEPAVNYIVPPMALSPILDTAVLERIADALERIADALEAEELEGGD